MLTTPQNMLPRGDNKDLWCHTRYVGFWTSSFLHAQTIRRVTHSLNMQESVWPCLILVRVTRATCQPEGGQAGSKGQGHLAIKLKGRAHYRVAMRARPRKAHAASPLHYGRVILWLLSKSSLCGVCLMHFG